MPKIFELPIYIQQIRDEDFLEYKIHSNLIGWNGKIFLESKNGIPQKLTQNIHPFLRKLGFLITLSINKKASHMGGFLPNYFLISRQKQFW